MELQNRRMPVKLRSVKKLTYNIFSITCQKCISGDFAPEIFSYFWLNTIWYLYTLLIFFKRKRLSQCIYSYFIFKKDL